MKLPVILLRTKMLVGDGARNNKNAIPNGKDVVDIDHLEDPLNEHALTPEELYGTFIEGYEESNEIFWVFTSPSGFGLKIAYNLFEGETIEQGQERIMSLFPEEWRKKPFYDKSTDLARCTFMVPRGNFLYYDEMMMFLESPSDEEIFVEGPYEDKIPYADIVKETQKKSSKMVTDEEHILDGETPRYQDKYDYQDIVETWWKQVCGGYPSKGDRHNAIRTLARHLLVIADDDADMVLKILWKNIHENPAFDQTFEEVKGCVEWARKCEPFAGVTQKMKQVLASLDNPQSDPAVEEQIEEDGLTPFEKRIVEMLPDLPLSLQYTLKDTRPKMMLPLITTLFPLFGSLASKVSYYTKGNTRKQYYLGLQSIVTCISGGGKSEFDEAIKLWKAPFAKEERRKREEEDEYKEAEEMRASTEKGKRRPQEAKRFLAPKISEPTIVDNLKKLNRAGWCGFQFTTELSTLVRAATTEGDIWELYRYAFDREEYSRDRYSKGSVSGVVDVALNWSVLGTLSQLAPLNTKSMLDSGQVNRISFSPIPDGIIWDDKPVQNAFTEEELRCITDASLRLSQAEGVMNVPMLIEEADQWREDIRYTALQNVDTPMKQASHRITNMMERYGIILHLLYGEEDENPTTLKFARLMADYFLQNYLDLWGSAVEETQEKMKVKRHGGCNQRFLESLPEKFSTEHMATAYTGFFKKTATAETLKTIRNTWHKQDLAKYDSKSGLWVKTKLQLQKEVLWAKGGKK